MHKLLIATNNQAKVDEIKEIFNGIYDVILSLKEAGISIDVVEDGVTYEDNAIKKACAVMELSGMDALADDSGLEVYALNNEPGVYSARYLGENSKQSEKNEMLLQRLKGIPDSGRGARFVCCMALSRKGKPTLTAYGYCEGMISDAPTGDRGFGYDPIFFAPEYGVTFAQMEPGLKNRLSHRYNALQNLREKLIQEITK